MDDNTFRDRRSLPKMTLHDALERYLATVTPNKRGQSQERNRIRRLHRHRIAWRSLDSLRAKDFADDRDIRLEEVSPTSVRLELALLSHLYTIAVKDWSLPPTHELKNVRKPSAGHGREHRLQGNEKERLLEAIQRPESMGTKLWLDACVGLAIETGMGGKPLHMAMR